jgi:hypothetical protein
MMTFKKNMMAAAGLAVSGLIYALPASAVPVLCEDTSKNHLAVDSQYVAGCLDAGTGNINGNENKDAFLLANPGLGYVAIGSSETGEADWSQNGYNGGFSLESSLWNTWDQIAIGFKFGTGNTPDEWFVYSLNESVSSGFWSFFGQYGTGGGLSHITLYGTGRAQVPEPGTLALFGIALAGIGLVGRRKQRAN